MDAVTIEDVLEKVGTAVVAAQIGSLLVMAAIVLWDYGRHRSMKHIVFIAISYILLTILVGGGVVFQIFYDGWSRTAAIVLTLIAFGFGDVALWQVWHHRHEVMELDFLKDIQHRSAVNSARIEKIFLELGIEDETHLTVEEVEEYVKQDLTYSDEADESLEQPVDKE